MRTDTKRIHISETWALRSALGVALKGRVKTAAANSYRSGTNKSISCRLDVIFRKDGACKFTIPRILLQS
jgi:hypothetical protein